MDTRNKLVKGAESLETAAIVKDKSNTREILVSLLIGIVNCGHGLANELHEQNQLAVNYKKERNENMTTLKNFSEAFNGIKDVLKKEKEAQNIQFESLKSDISTEMKSYASILKSVSPVPQTTNTDESRVPIDTTEIKNVVKDALNEANLKASRSCNFIVHGLDVHDVQEDAADLIEQVTGYRHVVLNVHPVNSKENSPLCVRVESPQVASDVLKNAHKLRSTSRYRTPEEQEVHKNLVKALRKRIEDEPTRWWFIRDGQILSAELHKRKPVSSSCSTISSRSNSVTESEPETIILSRSMFRPKSNKSTRTSLLYSDPENHM